MSGAGVADRSLDLLVTGAQDARHTVVLAHGAGQPMDGAAMELLAAAFTRAGVRVVRFEFPYMSRRRATGRSTAPDREPVLEQAWRSVIAQVAALPLGRRAASAAPGVGTAGTGADMAATGAATAGTGAGTAAPGVGTAGTGAGTAAAGGGTAAAAVGTATGTPTGTAAGSPNAAPTRTATGNPTGTPGGGLVIGGRSMGGRIASMVADDCGVRALLCFAYPFHPPGRPDRLRTAHLARLRTPTLILQGERDPFGSPAEVASYALPAAITVHWIADGDHSFKPRKRSGRTLQDNLADAVQRSVSFLDRL